MPQFLNENTENLIVYIVRQASAHEKIMLKYKIYRNFARNFNKSGRNFPHSAFWELHFTTFSIPEKLCFNTGYKNLRVKHKFSVLKKTKYLQL